MKSPSLRSARNHNDAAFELVSESDNITLMHLRLYMVVSATR